MNRRTTPSPLVVVAASASAAAGLVHAGAAGSHSELRTLATLFAVISVLQLAWAVIVWSSRNTALVLAGVGLHLAALAALVISRTMGIGFVEGLEPGTGVGLQDGMVAGLEVVAALAALVSLTATRPTRAAARLAPVLAAVALLAAVPAMATPHDHGSADHGAHDHDVTEVAVGERPTHDASQGHVDSHDDSDHHDDAAPDDAHAAHASAARRAPVPTDEPLPYPAGFTAWLDTADTPQQRAAAEDLLIETTEAMAAFPDEAAVQAAGFVSIGDGVTGWEHYIHLDRIQNPAILDPADIESIVLKVHPDGTKEVASAMYLLPFGTAMADAPDIAGDLTPWHDHQNLCWEGVRVVGTTGPDGSCARGEFRSTQPMMHVWVTDHPCGPFAGIEGTHGSGCDHQH